ncbi:PqqD family protein [Alkaliphilus serpentinus]|nr:PqqD family protein [Alkaliphilus serpentinus]
MVRNVYKRNILYRIRKLDNRNILFGPSHCLELNELALLIWNNLNGENNTEYLINLIQSQYEEIDKETIEKDILDFIEGLADKNIINACV